MRDLPDEAVCQRWNRTGGVRSSISVAVFVPERDVFVYSCPMSFLRGRVLESWSQPEGGHVVLAVEANHHLLSLPMELPVPPAGAIVCVTLNSLGTPIALELLGEPSTGMWQPHGDATRWIAPKNAVTRLEVLQKRQDVVRTLREDLYQEGFLEVQTPLLVPSTCPDVHMDSISVGSEYLATSTEYQLKRLLVGGAQRLFSLTQNFRLGDKGRFHNPEFTMLEWARAFETLDVIESDVERFTRAAWQRLHPKTSVLQYEGFRIHLMEPWERLTVREAFARYLGVYIEADFSLDSLQEGLRKARLPIPNDLQDNRHALVSHLLDWVQPHLGTKVPTFLREWPAFMTSSAALVPHNPHLAERSELFIAGIEIADGFPFLREAVLQEALFARENRLREQLGKPLVTLDDAYVTALHQGIPPGAGMALGIDRLVMVLTGCTHIRDTLAFSWDER